MKTAKQIIQEWKDAGFTYSEMTDAIKDGEVLKEYGIDQPTAEEVYNTLLEQSIKKRFTMKSEGA